jgi:hypothetical protein
MWGDYAALLGECRRVLKLSEFRGTKFTSELKPNKFIYAKFFPATGLSKDRQNTELTAFAASYPVPHTDP